MTCPDVTLDNFCAVKDPSELLDYTILYEALLVESDPPDAIVASTWVLEQHAKETTLSIYDDTQFTGLTATVWIEGGLYTGLQHKLINHVTTAAGREYERTITLWIQSK